MPPARSGGRPGQLATWLRSAQPVVLADVRWTLGGPPGEPEYRAGHLPGAVAHLQQGEGHLSVCVGSFEAMLDELVRMTAGLRTLRAG